MLYNIKPIPTEYRGAKFRSRLEARWAAFFDLISLPWDYEPFDLDGWAPDFVIRTKLGPALVEVKPFDITGFLRAAVETGKFETTLADYDKALVWRRKHQLLLLGAEPPPSADCMPIGIPVDPPLGATYSNDQIIDELTFSFETPASNLWYEAGSAVQWSARQHAA